jgi:hypothetical protein
MVIPNNMSASNFNKLLKSKVRTRNRIATSKYADPDVAGNSILENNSLLARKIDRYSLLH